MKAPRKTVKRPIFRHIEVAKNEVKIEIKKDDNKETKKPVVHKNKEVLNTPEPEKIEFSANLSPVLTIDPIDNFDDIDLNFGESFADIDDIEYNMLDIFAPLDFEGIV